MAQAGASAAIRHSTGARPQLDSSGIVQRKAEHFNTDSGISYSQPEEPSKELNYFAGRTCFQS